MIEIEIRSSIGSLLQPVPMLFDCDLSKVAIPGLEHLLRPIMYLVLEAFDDALCSRSSDLTT